MKKHIFPGLRTIKTALAVFICVISVTLLGDFFGFEITGFYAGITAVFTLQTSAGSTKRRAKHRILGTLIGTLVAVVLLFLKVTVLLYIPVSIFIFVGIILAIHICYWLEITDGVLISCILVLACFAGNNEFYISYALIRTLETFWGAFIGIIVNRYVFKYDPI